MKPITPDQIKKIQVLITQQCLRDFKEGIIGQFTNTRTISVKEMYLSEAKELIQALTTQDRNEPLRKKIIALAYKAGIIYGDTPEDKKINAAKLNMFLRERGTVKKDLFRMNYDELTRTISQFHQININNRNSEAVKSTKSLLKELNIKVSTQQTTNS